MRDFQDILIFTKEFVIPIFGSLLSLAVAIFGAFVAYRRGMFSAPTPPSTEKVGPSSEKTGPIEAIRSISLDAEKIDEYHNQSLSQARTSFWFSLVFASLGFFIICTSIFLYSGNTAVLGIISGTIIDAVSALFFYQSNKARQLMSEFFDRLRVDRKMTEALSLCDAIDNSQMKDSLRVTLSLYFAGLERVHETAKDIVSANLGSTSETTGNASLSHTVTRSTDQPAPDLRVAT